MTESPFIVDLTEENYDLVVGEGSRERPVLVDFWASWCQPCQALMPLLARLAKEYGGKFILAKLNTEEQKQLAGQFGIRSIPTVKLFPNGQPVDEFMGALPEAEIRRFLDRHIPRESDNLAERAKDMIRSGDVDGARKLIQEAQATDPDNPRVLLSAIRLQADLGNIDEAEAAITDLPTELQGDPEIAGLRARFLFDREARSVPPAAQLETALAQGDTDSDLLFGLAAHRVLESRLDAALDLLIELLKRDPDYRDNAARKGMLAIFEILGGSGELVNRYRNKMFNLLH